MTCMCIVLTYSQDSKKIPMKEVNMLKEANKNI